MGFGQTVDQNSIKKKMGFRVTVMMRKREKDGFQTNGRIEFAKKNDGCVRNNVLDLIGE